MTKKRPTLEQELSTRLYSGADIPMRVIRRYARRIAEQFHPDKIILFGSYAYGTPHADSDVDLLVIMPARNNIDQAVRISWEIPAPFPMDLLVRTPKNLAWRLRAGDWFLREIVARGKVLHEAAGTKAGTEDTGRIPRRHRSLTAEWIKKAEASFRCATLMGRGERSHHEQVCLHCQQSAENYLKALLQDLGVPVTRTHDLEVLLQELLPHQPSLRPLRRGLCFLAGLSVDVWHPGKITRKRQAVAALSCARRVREACRSRLGVPERRENVPT